MAFSADQMKGVGPDEISKLTKAMKDDQFRSYMDEYTKEISDPKNRKEYITYLEQLEAKGEMPEGQALLRTEPGCCVKTSIRFKNGQTQKCFINIVHCDRLDDLTLIPAENGGRQAHLPYSLSPPRPDRDHNDEYCMTTDFAVSSRTFVQATQNPQILKMLVDTAADGMASQFLKGYEEVNKDYKVMKRLNCKGGFPMPMSVNTQMLKDKGAKNTPAKNISQDAVTPGELKKMRQDAKEKTNAKKKDFEQAVARHEAEETASKSKAVAAVEDKAPRIRVPAHRLVHSGLVDLTDFMEVNKMPTNMPTTTVPKLLKLIVELPTIKRSSDITLEVTKMNVVVEVPEKYYLDLPLSYEIEENNGVAKFDKAKQELTLELPVVPKPPIFNPAAQAFAEMAAEKDDDGALSEGHASEDELPALEQEEEEEEQATSPPPAEAPQEPPAEAPPPEEPPQATAERLEFDMQSSALHIATEEAPAADRMDEAPAEDLAPFIASEVFDGARPGYFFGTGDDGLGYYLDRRQPRHQRSKPVTSALTPGGQIKLPGTAAAEAAAAPSTSERSSMPLVTEVATRVPEVAAETARAPLPADLQVYLDDTSALATRLPAEVWRQASGSKANASGDLPVEGCQSRQNVIMRVTLPPEQEVADLRLVLAGQCITLAFLARPRPASAAAPWRRYELSRMLCGLVDPRQWHAELASEAQATRLVVVLRKAERKDFWSEVFDAVVPAAVGFSSAPELGGDGLGSEGVGTQKDAAEQEIAAASAEAAVSSGAGVVSITSVAEDSAELDAAAPVVHGSDAKGPSQGGVAASPLQPSAAAALVQSATVMGQSVLLRNRLMYQLL